MNYSVHTLCDVFIDFLNKHDATSLFINNLQNRNHKNVTGIYTYVEKHKEQPANLIYHAFTWHESPERRSYWERLHYMWEDTYIDLLNGKTLKYKSIW